MSDNSGPTPSLIFPVGHSIRMMSHIETSSPKKGNAMNAVNEGATLGKNTGADNSFNHPPINFEHELMMRPLPILDVSYPV